MKKQTYTGDELLEREPSFEERALWTELNASEDSTKQKEQSFLSVLIFRLGSELLAIETMEFEEVMEKGPVHRVPHRTGRILQGLVNIRGRLVLCLSLHALLSGANDFGESSHFLVLDGPQGRLAFPVSEVLGIDKITLQNLQPPRESSFIKAILTWHQHSVGLLEAEKVRGALQECASR